MTGHSPGPSGATSIGTGFASVHRMGLSGSRGFSLVEAVVATGIVVTAFGVLGSLASIALKATMGARDRTMAAVLAQSAYERLASTRPLPSPAPVDTLAEDVPGWVEYADGQGRTGGRDPAAAGTVFVCRWRVASWGGHADLRVIAVAAGRCRPPVTTPRCSLGTDAVVVTGLRSEAVW